MRLEAILILHFHHGDNRNLFKNISYGCRLYCTPSQRKGKLSCGSYHILLCLNGDGLQKLVSYYIIPFLQYRHSEKTLTIYLRLPIYELMSLHRIR